MAFFQNPLPSRILSLMSCSYEVPFSVASYSLSTSLDNKSKHHKQPVYSSYSHAAPGLNTLYNGPDPVTLHYDGP